MVTSNTTLKASQHARFLYHHAWCIALPILKAPTDIKGCCLQDMRPGLPGKLIATPKKAVTRHGKNWPGSSTAGTSLGATRSHEYKPAATYNDSKGNWDAWTEAEPLRQGQLCLSSVQHRWGCWAAYSTGTWLHRSKFMVWMISNPESMM